MRFRNIRRFSFATVENDITTSVFLNDYVKYIESFYK